MAKAGYRARRTLFAAKSPDSAARGSDAPRSAGSSSASPFARLGIKSAAFLFRALKRLCLFIGAMFLIGFLGGLLATGAGLEKSGAVHIPDKAILFLPLKGEFPESDVTSGGFSDPFAPRNPNVHDIIRAIDAAIVDNRVQGIYARMEGVSMGLAQLQELREALSRFKASGKFMHVYATSYGESGGMGEYYLASVFSTIWMQPMGTVSILGLSAQIPFFKAALDKIGLEPEFLQRKEYKSAYESLMREDISPANAQAMGVLLEDIRAGMFSAISADRKMSAAAFSTLVDKGLLTTREALSARLIDKSDYADVIVGDIAEAYTGDRDAIDEVFVPVDSYMFDMFKKQKQPKGGGALKLPASLKHEKPRVAVVRVEGAIMPSATNVASASGSLSVPLSMMNEGIAAADEIAPAIIEAANDETIGAIVLRVDSPGGSPTASETILRAVERAQKKGKPVIVSMGAAAASGGYWVSAYADRIFAMPGTITGSIGVLGGKVSAAGLWKKLGVNWADMTYGENAKMLSMNTPFSESEKERMNAMLDQIYDGFIARVAKGRKMENQAVELVAKGRVWSGARAVQIGLVDEIGGMADALDYTAELLGAPDAQSLEIVNLPAEKTLLEQIMQILEDGGMVKTFVNGFAAMAQTWREIISVIMPAVLATQNPVSVYEPVSVVSG